MAPVPELDSVYVTDVEGLFFFAQGTTCWSMLWGDSERCAMKHVMVGWVAPLAALMTASSWISGSVCVC